MCHPADYNDRVREAVGLISDLYALAPTGGPLHVVVDDWNVEDGDLVPHQSTRDDGQPWYAPEVMDVACRLAEVMRAMSMAERISALAHQEGALAEGKPTKAGESYLETHRLNLADVAPEDRPCTCLPAGGHG